MLDGERLAVVETEIQNIKSIVENQALVLKHIDTKLDVKFPTFATKSEIAQLKKSNVIQNTLSAILGSILTFLIGYFILGISKG